MAEDKRVCVVGAGSSGIVAAKILKQGNIDFDCFEKGSGIGGNWRFRNDNGMSASYRSLHINTSKERMAYSDFPMPEDFPDYPHHSQVLEYFEAYVDHFDLRSHIQFRTEVTSITRTQDGRWSVEIRRLDSEEHSETRSYDAVLVANGHHWHPRMPEPAFEGSFQGRTLHSHDYETFEGFEDRRVLIVGIGNSGVDIACELSRVAAKTFISTRRGAHILPKYALGKPIDQLAGPRGSNIPLAVQRRIYELLLALARGNQERYGVPLPDHHVLQAHPTISADLLNLVGHGKIHMKPNVERLDGDGVVFTDGSREPLDVIIYATGYKIRFPFLSDDLIHPQANEVRLYRHVAHPDLPGLYFLGLIQPLGAIMPLAEAQAEWVARLIDGRCSLPDPATMKRRIAEDREATRKRYVTSKRHTIQVDFYPYLHLIQREASMARS